MKKENQILFGRNPALEAFKEGLSIDKVFLQIGTRGDLEKQVRHYCKEHTIPLSMVPKERLNRMSRGNHQGIIIRLSPVPFYRVSDLVPMLFEQDHFPNLVLLDGVQDARNLGAISRSAWSFGVDGIIVPMQNSAPISDYAMKASSGALAKIPVCREKSLGSTVEYLHQSGFEIWAGVAQGGQDISKMDANKPIAVLMGSEGEGIQPKLLQMASYQVRITQAREFDSLNVSVAAGIFFYEIFRSRRKSFLAKEG